MKDSNTNEIYFAPKLNRRVTLLAVLLIQVSLLFSSCKDQNLNSAEGVLKGKISIGPICPVEKIPPDPACLPTLETFKAYLTAIWTSDKKIKIKDLLPRDSSGFYQIYLRAGTYLIDFSDDRIHHIGGSNLPASITIIPNDTTTFNMNIDTGIR